jgi:hypothetical protein
MKNQGNVTPPKENNATITDFNSSEVEKSQTNSTERL